MHNIIPMNMGISEYFIFVLIGVFVLVQIINSPINIGKTEKSQNHG